MHIPSSTYRIQLNKDFRLEQLQHIIDYLHQLGVSTVYASPVTTASPGSMHGYDVTDPHTINPEIGTLSTLKTIGDRLAAKNMNWLQDIVPNHMAFAPENFRLMDVLERNAHSEYYRYFDINLLHPDPDLSGKLMVPFLGSDLETAIENRDIKLTFSEEGFCIRVYDSCYPLSLAAYYYLAALVEEAEHSAPIYNSIKTLADKGMSGMSYEDWKDLKEGWIANCLDTPSKCNKINHALERINNDSTKMQLLLQQQHYILCHWQRTMQEINYRRFFTVNNLICLRMEDEQVFEEYHRFLHALSTQGIIHGLRIDHIDGLYNPTQYISRLRKLFGKGCYIIAEKILEANEHIPSRWKLNGTSGYEFLSYTNRLLTSGTGAEQLLQFYRELVAGQTSYKELVNNNKTLILEKHMAGEWDNLTRQFFELQLQKNFSREKIKQTIAALMIALPVYRIYPDSHPLQEAEAEVMKEAFKTALKMRPDCREEIEYMQNLFNGKEADEHALTNFKTFFSRLMQFTGPLTAKGVEDTTFYVYNHLISHNEVGDDPSVPSISVDQFHEIMRTRRQQNALSLNATSTHDTKRGEDARMRINVLSEMAEEWKQKVKDWFEMNASVRQQIEGKATPSVNDEYFIYQSLIGGWPITGKPDDDELVERMEAFIVKALRESKMNSNYESPAEDYENACVQFIKKLLDRQHAFLGSLTPFAEKVSEFASIYSLVQTVIKLTAPGIPDIYQGSELWDFSFVDPDNRRPVDYAKRRQMLAQITEKEKEGNPSLISFVNENWREGYEKMLVTHKLLHYRRNDPTLFTEGEYSPIPINSGETEAIAYSRRYDGKQIAVIAPLNIVSRYANKKTLDKSYAGNIELPGHWRNIFTGETFTSSSQLALQEILQSFPVAVLEKL